MKDSRIILEYHDEMESHKWREEIPFIKFPKDWEVQMIPPFGGAVVRFVIKKGKNTVSIYLDCYEQLGVFGSPYWEIYPVNGGVMRVGMNEIKRLLAYIKINLETQ